MLIYCERQAVPEVQYGGKSGVQEGIVRKSDTSSLVFLGTVIKYSNDIPNVSAKERVQHTNLDPRPRRKLRYMSLATSTCLTSMCTECNESTETGMMVRNTAFPQLLDSIILQWVLARTDHNICHLSPCQPSTAYHIDHPKAATGTNSTSLQMTSRGPFSQR